MGYNQSRHQNSDYFAKRAFISAMTAICCVPLSLLFEKIDPNSGSGFSKIILPGSLFIGGLLLITSLIKKESWRFYKIVGVVLYAIFSNN